MKYYYPDYFNHFECVPGKACPDSCCIRWQITVDPATLEKYKKVPGKLGERMKKKIDFCTGCIASHGEEHRCEFLNDDNLCDIVLELGEEYLSETCHTHPRHEEVYPNVRERSLAMTCPIACKQLLDRVEPVKIKSKTVASKKEHDRKFDQDLFELLLECRDIMISIAQNRKHSIMERMVLILAFSHDISKRIVARNRRVPMNRLKAALKPFPDFTQEELGEIKEIKRSYQEKKAYDQVTKHLEEIIRDEKMFRQEKEHSVQHIMTDMIFALSTMEALKPSWPPYLQSVLNVRGEFTKESSREFMEEYATQENETELEQLLVYFIYVYCCTSAYDGELLAKSKMAVVNVLLIREFWFMNWLENDKKLTLEDKAELAHWYVREIENSDENMEQWDSLMLRSPRYALKKILKVLHADMESTKK